MSKIISEIVGSILNFIPRDKIKSILISEKFIIPYLQFGDLDCKVLCSLNKEELKEVIKNCMWNRQKTFLYACKNGYISIVELLLKDSRVDPAFDNNKAISRASEFGHYRVVELLLKDSRVDPRVWDNQAIRWASEYGHRTVVELLLNWRGPSDSQGRIKRVDPTAQNNQAIISASGNGHRPVTELLLNWRGPSDSQGRIKRVDPSDNVNYAIHLACGNGHRTVTELLLKDSRVDPRYNNTCIILASMHGYYEIVKLLLDWRGPLDYKGGLKTKRVYPVEEAIYWAGENGHTSVVDLLLKYKE